MPKVMLRLRELQSGEAGLKEVASVDAAVAWLKERPENTEVIGVVFEGISREDNERMKQAMRPLSAAEAELVQELEDRAADERERQEEKRRAEAEASNRAAREAAKKADPNRPMEVRYQFNKTALEKTDALDERPITEEATKAVMAYVAEREEWVKDRGQTIGEAKVTVYPNTVPAGSERVTHGSWVPVTAAAKT